MRWLARLLHERRKKPRRAEARVFLARHTPTPVTDVLNMTVDMITGTRKEGDRQHRESLPARRAPPPPPTTNKDVSPTTPQLPPSPPADGNSHDPPRHQQPALAARTPPSSPTSNAPTPPNSVKKRP